MEDGCPHGPLPVPWSQLHFSKAGAFAFRDEFLIWVHTFMVGKMRFYPAIRDALDDREGVLAFFELEKDYIYYKMQWS